MELRITQITIIVIRRLIITRSIVMPIIIATSPTVAIIKCPIIENVVRNRYELF